MDHREQARALLRTLGAGLGVALEPDADEACGLRIDGRLDLTLRFESSPPALLAYAPVGTLPEDGGASLRRLLEANHLWEGSRGATWSLAGTGVVLSRLFPLEGLEAEALARELARFVDVARAEQERLSGAVLPGSAGLPPLGMITA